MGKLINNIVGQPRPKCADETAPICASVCCGIETQEEAKQKQKLQTRREIRNKNVKPSTIVQDEDDNDNDIKELVVVGAGPHSLSLMLRLLEPEADLLSDKTRHYRAHYDSKMRPIAEVRKHIQKLSKGPSATLKKKRKPNKNGKRSKNANTNEAKASDAFNDGTGAPNLSLETVRRSVMVVDSTSDRWLSHWKQNFEAIGIPKLRSLMNAHADPYDHRSLEIYAESKGRDEELVPLPSLTQRDSAFHGPYQVPSTRLFNEFHDLLARGYGIDDIVQKGTVQSIGPVQNEGADGEPLFRITMNVKHGTTSEGSATPPSTATTTVKARRVVCAMGPMFRTGEAFWEAALRKELASNDVSYPSNRILHASEIVPLLREIDKPQKQKQPQLSHHCGTELPVRRLLIVGGGITSAQLAIVAAKSTWCHSVKLIQRSKSLSRHFDIENKWMGPRRGQLLDEFWSLNMFKRAQLIRDARLGGSIPPDILKELVRHTERPIAKLKVQEEVQVSQVHWSEPEGLFRVKLDDGSDFEEYDMIWLVTGSENHLDNYSVFSRLRKVLPVDVVGGLPVLTKDLSWRCPPAMEADEPSWKQGARKRMWCVGSLAGLELGPDALNLVGARHGAVRVASNIRKDMM
mmetsp:Transcript_724/g.1726  ORF Transcript_724/g.1726 Transcript_724/m.1726 type:complete len:631 (-) Transcript_724:2497-4389(-)